MLVDSIKLFSEYNENKNLKNVFLLEFWNLSPIIKFISLFMNFKISKNICKFDIVRSNFSLLTQIFQR